MLSVKNYTFKILNMDYILIKHYVENDLLHNLPSVVSKRKIILNKLCVIDGFPVTAHHQVFYTSHINCGL